MGELSLSYLPLVIVAPSQGVPHSPSSKQVQDLSFSLALGICGDLQNHLISWLIYRLETNHVYLLVI